MEFIAADKNGKQVGTNKSHCWRNEAAPLCLCNRDKRLPNIARHHDANEPFWITVAN